MTESNLVHSENSTAFLTDKTAFAHTAQVANYFSKSKMIPEVFHNKPEDCLVVLMMAQQLEVNPLLCFQNMNVIHGRPSFSSAFAIGLANKRGPFKGPLRWTTDTSKGLKVTCHAVIESTDEAIEISADMEMAQRAGWTKNKIYQSIPEQMLRYRSATMLIRLYCPEVLCGLHSVDEIIDITPNNQTAKVSNGINKEVDLSTKIDNTGKSDSVIDSINASISESVDVEIGEKETKDKSEIF